RRPHDRGARREDARRPTMPMEFTASWKPFMTSAVLERGARDHVRDVLAAVAGVFELIDLPAVREPRGPVAQIAHVAHDGFMPAPRSRSAPSRSAARPPSVAMTGGPIAHRA